MNMKRTAARNLQHGDIKIDDHLLVQRLVQRDLLFPLRSEEYGEFGNEEDDNKNRRNHRHYTSGHPVTSHHILRSLF